MVGNHGNIQRFVRHGVLGGKLIITSALWLCWGPDRKTTGLILSSLSLSRLMELTDFSRWEFNWFLSPPNFFLSAIEPTLGARIRQIDKKKKRKRKTADGASAAYNLGKLIRCTNTFMWYERHHLLVTNTQWRTAAEARTGSVSENKSLPWWLRATRGQVKWINTAADWILCPRHSTDKQYFEKWGGLCKPFAQLNAVRKYSASASKSRKRLLFF